eukprot:3075151-Rhodomonas_salina.2
MSGTGIAYAAVCATQCPVLTYPVRRNAGTGHNLGKLRYQPTRLLRDVRITCAQGALTTPMRLPASPNAMEHNTPGQSTVGEIKGNGHVPGTWCRVFAFDLAVPRYRGGTAVLIWARFVYQGRAVPPRIGRILVLLSAISLRACYAVSGAATAYGAAFQCPVLRCTADLCYAPTLWTVLPARRCPVLRYGGRGGGGAARCQSRLCAVVQVPAYLAPRNQTQETAFLVQIVLKLQFLVLDFGVYLLPPCCALSPTPLLNPISYPLAMPCPVLA